jgi:hypothetical protein
MAVTPPAYAAPARRVALCGGAAEIALSTYMERRLGPLADAYSTGAAQRFGIAAKALLAAGAVTTAAAGRSRAVAAAAGALVTAGAVCARWSVFRAGFQSAADPRHTIASQRR